MNWEQRLREMMLAGGALAVTACGGATAAQADAASSAVPNSGIDAAGSQDGGSGDDVADIRCCINVAVDPCGYACDVGADAASCVACRDAENACWAMNGMFELNSGGMPGCYIQGALEDAGDAGGVDAGPEDAAEDVHVVVACCNANPDPCCGLLDCNASPDAAIYVVCEQNRTQCEAMNGYYNYQPDGSIGCTPPAVDGH